MLSVNFQAESSTSCENGDPESAEMEGLFFIVARWGSWMQLLLTTTSLREEKNPQSSSSKQESMKELFIE